MSSTLASTLLKGMTTWLLTSGVKDVPEVEAGLSATILQRRGVILIGHANVLLVSLTIWLITGRSWALVWLLGELSLLCLRLYVYGKAQSAASDGRVVDYRPLVATGIAWTLLLGLGSAATIIDGNTAAMLLAGINVAGILGGISSRNGATPRYAITLILAAGVPLGVAAWFTDVQWLFLAGIEILLLVMGIIMVTLQNHAIVRAMLQAQNSNRQLSLTDTLTGLRNRSALTQCLDLKLAGLRRGELSEENRFAVLCLDLDGFKAVNDTYGHGAGDTLLYEVARRLEQSVRPGDELFRIGGDEFVIILNAVAPEETNDVCEQILEGVRRPFVLTDVATVGIGISIGSMLVARLDHDGAALIKRADSALYEAKRTGRNRHVVFDTALEMKLIASSMARTVEDSAGQITEMKTLASASMPWHQPLAVSR